MNHPVQIPPHYKSDSFYFLPVIDSEFIHSPYRTNINKYIYTDKNNINYYKLEINILDKKTKSILYTFSRNTDSCVMPILVRQNDKEFILTSGDFQCISIYNVTDNIFTDYVYGGDEAYEEDRGFCPKDYVWNDKTQTLFIYGKIDFGPPEVLMIHNPDFQNLNFDNIEWTDWSKEPEYDEYALQY